MDTTVTHQSKPQWRFERPHRVRLFAHKEHINNVYNNLSTWDDKSLYLKAAELFSKTDRYQWAETNGVRLDFDIDDNSIDWFKQVRFYADLTEEQYVDYSLRFFRHLEEWK